MSHACLIIAGLLVVLGFFLFVKCMYKCKKERKRLTAARDANPTIGA